MKRSPYIDFECASAHFNTSRRELANGQSEGSWTKRSVWWRRLWLIGLLAVTAWMPSSRAQTSAFSYQGRLSDGGQPAQGAYDLGFGVYDAQTSGAMVGTAVELSGVQVEDGVFSVVLDFGVGAFDGSARWLEIGVLPGGDDGAYTTLLPRQALMAPPYALFALSGNEGPQGAQGPGGPEGETGAMGPQGLQGEQGVQGGQGEPGSDGISIQWLGSLASPPSSPMLNQAYHNTTDQMAYIFDAAGQWQVLARDGAEGPQGAIGQIGPEGPQGPSGEVGPEGPQGVAGPQGPQGLQGEPGPEGPSGSADAWSRVGNAGTDPAINFLGTTDDTPFEVRVNGDRVLRIEDKGDSSDDFSVTDGAPSLIGGSPANYLGTDAVGSTISGGGAVSYGGDPAPNKILSHYGVVAGGRANTIEAISSLSVISGGSENHIDEWASQSVIGGGTRNSVQTRSSLASIAGGGWNSVSSKAMGATIGGGAQNEILARSEYAIISGGERNKVGTDSSYSVIGGGVGNRMWVNSCRATIAGGSANNIWTNSENSTIGGGSGNYVNNGVSATIPGGERNVATGDYAFAAGQRAKAYHLGAFVWADSTEADFASSADNQFLIRASGGVGIGTTNPVSRLTVAGSGAFNSSSSAAIALHNTTANRRWQWHVLDSGSVQLAEYTAGLTRMMVNTLGNVGIGVVSPTQRLHVSGNILATGTVTGSSDRNVKENFVPVDPEQVLEKVASMPIRRWNYIGEDTPHLGPVAQDFYQAFKVGMDDKHISMVDADGVALAAIQGLNRKTESLRAELEQRAAENAALKRELAALKQLVHSLAPASNGVAR